MLNEAGDIKPVKLNPSSASQLAIFVAACSGVEVDWQRSEPDKYDFYFTGDPMACRNADETVHKIMESYRFLVSIGGV